MSIFDPNSQLNPIPWLQEKTLAALVEAARLVDLANEPDTTDWYARTLKEHARRLIGRLAPMTALVHGAGQEAADHAAWGPIVDRGMFALARWQKDFGVQDPGAELNLLATDPPDDADEKQEVVEQEIIDAEDQRTLNRRLMMYAAIARRMMLEELSEPARLLLLWLLHEIQLSPYADVAAVSKRFLPGDIGVSSDDALAAYRELYDKSFIERVDALPNLREDALALRIVVSHLNESKHKPPFRDETFGFKGDVIGGRRTIGNRIFLELETPMRAALRRWRRSDVSLDAVRDAIQERVDQDRIFIESVQFRTFSDGTEGLDLSVRYPLEDDEEDFGPILGTALDDALRELLAEGGDG